jgi:hypothetical protein
MRDQNPKNNTGFTLIEAVIYLALFGIIFSGALAGCYAAMEAGAKNQARATMQNEIGFIAAKINWALAAAQNTQIPAPGFPLPSLLAETLDGSGATAPIVFYLDRNSLMMKIGSDEALPLNNGNIRVVDLLFENIPPAGPMPAEIKTDFKIIGLASNGAEINSGPVSVSVHFGN